MSGAAAPLTLPSAARFVGIWAPGNENCPLTLQDLVIIHNTLVKMRATKTSGWHELSGYSNKFPQFLKQWPYRFKQIKAAFRIECVGGEDNADTIPPLFLQSWNKELSLNAQNDFITDAFAKTMQLAHMSAEQSFSDFYEATYRKLPTNMAKMKLNSADETQTLSMICILEYKFLAGCDKQWRERPAEPSNFLRDADEGADQEAARPSRNAPASPPRRGRSAAGGAAGAASSSAGSKKNAEPGAAAPAPAGNGGSNAEPEDAAAAAAAPAGERAEQDLRHDMYDIVSWGLNDDEFPLNQLDDMQFDVARPLGEQRTYHAAAVLLFYRRRTKEQEKVFRALSGVWGVARGTFVNHVLLGHPPTAGPTMYTPKEIDWCKDARKALIAKMDDELRRELEIPEPAQEKVPGRRARARGEELEGQGVLLQPAK